MFSFFNKNKSESIEVNELDKHLSNIQLIDIREPYETQTGTLKGARKVPMNTLLNHPEQYLKKDQDYYIMCQSGMRSSRTVNLLSKLGYHVINVRGGISSYHGRQIQG